MSTIVKRGSTWYYHRGRTSRPDSLRKSLKTKNKLIAQQLQKELDVQYAKISLGLEPLLIIVTLADARDSFVKSIEYKKEKDLTATKTRPNSHYKKQVLHINKFVEFSKPNIKMNSITASMIIDWKSHLLKKFTNKTSRDYLLTLREFLQFCLNKAYLGIPIFDNLPKSFLPSAKPTKKRRPIPLGVIKEVISKAPNEKDKVYWEIMLYTMLRRVDAGTLTMNDIIQGKYQGKTKEPIPLGLPPKIKDNPKLAVMICPDEYGQRESLARYQALMKDRGYETDFHAIRHSVATHLSRCGYKESDIKRIVGWHSTAVDNYIHSGSEELSLLLNNF